MSICKYSLRVLFILLFGSFFINLCSASEKISVIVPVYNVEKYLRECIESIINQTHNNWEIIFVNDGSTDGSKNILEEYAKKDGNRIKVIDQDKNKGVLAARNVGLDYATGEYVMFVNGDDCITHRDAFKILMGFSFLVKDSDIFEFGDCHGEGIFPLDGNDKYFCLLLCGEHRLPGVLYRREFLMKNNLKFNEKLELEFFRDAEFYHRAFSLAGKVCVLNGDIYFSRKREDSLCGNLSRDKNGIELYLSAFLKFTENIFEFYKKSGVLEGNKEKIAAYFSGVFSDLLVRYIVCMPEEMANRKHILGKSAIKYLELYKKYINLYELKEDDALDGRCVNEGILEGALCIKKETFHSRLECIKQFSKLCLIKL